MQLPSERIQKLGDSYELISLKKTPDIQHIPKTSFVYRLYGQVREIATILDEFDERLSKLEARSRPDL